MQALDAGKIQSVSIFMGDTLADFKCAGAGNSSGYVYDISTKDLPALIKKMMDRGVAVEFASARKVDKADFIFNILPMVLLLLSVGYIFLIQKGKRA